MAVALVRTKSDAERDQLLTQKVQLNNAELLVALKSLADPLVQKGEYNEAVRISQLAVRIAEQQLKRRVKSSCGHGKDDPADWICSVRVRASQPRDQYDARQHDRDEDHGHPARAFAV